MVSDSTSLSNPSLRSFSESARKEGTDCQSKRQKGGTANRGTWRQAGPGHVGAWASGFYNSCCPVLLNSMSPQDDVEVKPREAVPCKP